MHIGTIFSLANVLMAAAIPLLGCLDWTFGLNLTNHKGV